MVPVECPSCSAQVERGERSCPSCGGDLRADDDERTEVGTRLTRDALEFVPGETFADRFTIIERVSSGGMGVVYKAIDTELDSVVALKLIQPALARQPAFVERFRREVRVTRQITHPNICRVHDIGISGEIHYLSMEWIEGETLHQLLRQAGTLRESRALEIASKVALALEAAHDKGIIHRDLKPANVMVGSRGTVHVLDFGLAREEGSERMTGVGVAIGTPMYMSPEQRAGANLDVRTDLYSVGAILTEMLIGRPPAPDVPPDQTLPPELNPLIAPVLKRLLARNPADRHPSAAALRADLDTLRKNPAISSAGPSPRPSPVPLRRLAPVAILAGAATIVVFVAAGFYYLLFLKPAEVSLQPEARQYYARGMDYLREDLERLQGIDDAIHMFHKADGAQPGSALVMAALAEAYWRRFEKDQSAVSRESAERWLRKAGAVEPGLPEVRLARALGQLLEGKHQAARTELEQAVAERPRFATAWAALADAYRSLGLYEDGRKAVERALELEPGSFRMHMYAGFFHERFQEYSMAAEYYEKAAELKPDSYRAWINVGTSLLYTGRPEQAIPAFRRSLQIEENAPAHSNLGTAYYLVERYEEAVPHFRRAAQIEPKQALWWGNLGDGLLKLGQTEQATAAYRRAAEVAKDKVIADPLDVDAAIVLARFCAHAKDAACALEYGARALGMQPQNADLLLTYSQVHVLLGRDDDALDLLERALKLGASRTQVEAYPEFERLQDHLRYREILATVE